MLYTFAGTCHCTTEPVYVKEALYGGLQDVAAEEPALEVKKLGHGVGAVAPDGQ